MSSTSDAAVACAGVSKSFGPVRALEGIDLMVRPGESVGLLGPNGAGKSTLLGLIAGLRRPDSGQVRLLGADPVRAAARRGLGMTPQVDALPDTLRVGEVVDLVRAHHPDPVGARELLGLVGLESARGRQCGALSGGQRRRISLALALAGRPRVLLLDEPTAGLDTDSRDVVGRVVERAREDGVTVLLSSHDLRDVERGCERVVVLSGGRIVADDTLEDFRARARARRLRARTTAGLERLRDLPGVLGARVVEAGATIEASGGSGGFEASEASEGSTGSAGSAGSAGSGAPDERLADESGGSTATASGAGSPKESPNRRSRLFPTATPKSLTCDDTGGARRGGDRDSRFGETSAGAGRLVELDSADSDASLRALLSLDPDAHDILVQRADLDDVLRSTLRGAEQP